MKKDIFIILVNVSVAIALYELYSMFLTNIENRTFAYYENMEEKQGNEFKTKPVGKDDIITKKEAPNKTASAWD